MTSTITFPDVMIQTFAVHYGVPVSAVGEDGDLIALGHHDVRRVVAAFNRYTRRDLGWQDLFDNGRTFYRDAADGVEKLWAVLTTECRAAREDWHPSESCPDCAEIAATYCYGGWWIRWDANESDEGAFPVMMLEQQ